LQIPTLDAELNARAIQSLSLRPLHDSPVKFFPTQISSLKGRQPITAGAPFSSIWLAAAPAALYYSSVAFCFFSTIFQAVYAKTSLFQKLTAKSLELSPAARCLCGFFSHLVQFNRSVL
jgi:hypothetical protein